MFIVIFIPIGEVIILFSQFGDIYIKRGGEYISSFRPSKKEKKRRRRRNYIKFCKKISCLIE